MAPLGRSSSGRLILDSGGVLALARGDPKARSIVRAATERGFLVAIPAPVVAEVHRGGRRDAAVDRVLTAVDMVIPTSETVARRAGELLGAAGLDDPVDAIVVAEALASLPAMILTSDSGDVRRLLETQSDRARVSLVTVEGV